MPAAVLLTLRAFFCQGTGAPDLCCGFPLDRHRIFSMQLPLRAKRVGRGLRANLIYVRLLAVEFRATIILAASILLLGSVLFHFFQVSESGERPDYADSLYRTFILEILGTGHATSK